MALAERWPKFMADRWRKVGAIALLLLGSAMFDTAVRADGIEVVVSPEHADVALDRTLLRAFFTMHVREWPDGQPVRVFVLPDSSDVHDQFCREQLGIYPYVLRSAWDRMVYTGTGFAPETVRSESEMRQKIRTTPGAIGYIRRASGTDSGKPGFASADLTKETSHEK